MIRIMTESPANLPAKIAEELKIEVMPTHVFFGNKSYREGVNLSPSDFYRMLAEAQDLPSTSQASVEDYANLYQKLLSSAPEVSVISVHTSGALSGGIDSARAAAAGLPEAKIHIFDSLSVNLGQGLMAHEAARMALAGNPETQILERLQKMRDQMRLFWVVDTLEYLAKSGRIGRAARLLGGLLNMKPILTITDGAVNAYSRQRGRSQALAALRDLALKELRGHKGVQIGICHAVCEDDAQNLATDLQEVVSTDVLLMDELAPSLGVYSGPGTITLCWWTPDD